MGEILYWVREFFKELKDLIVYGGSTEPSRSIFRETWDQITSSKVYRWFQERWWDVKIWADLEMDDWRERREERREEQSKKL